MIFFNLYFQYLPPNIGVWLAELAQKIFVETSKPTWFTFTFCYRVVQNIGVLWVLIIYMYVHLCRHAYGHPDSDCTYMCIHELHQILYPFETCTQVTTMIIYAKSCLGMSFLPKSGRLRALVPIGYKLIPKTLFWFWE